MNTASDVNDVLSNSSYAVPIPTDKNGAHSFSCLLNVLKILAPQVFSSFRGTWYSAGCPTTVHHCENPVFKVYFVCSQREKLTKKSPYCGTAAKMIPYDLHGHTAVGHSSLLRHAWTNRSNTGNTESRPALAGCPVFSVFGHIDLKTIKNE